MLLTNTMKNLKKYKIQDREAGNPIEQGLTLSGAEKQVASHEEEDKADDTYTLDFYEIVEEIK